jgi:hypothetical protein
VKFCAKKIALTFKKWRENCGSIDCVEIFRVYNGSQLRGHIKRKVQFEITFKCSKAKKQIFFFEVSEAFGATFFWELRDIKREKWPRLGDDAIAPGKIIMDGKFSDQTLRNFPFVFRI